MTENTSNLSFCFVRKANIAFANNHIDKSYLDRLNNPVIKYLMNKQPNGNPQTQTKALYLILYQYN